LRGTPPVDSHPKASEYSPDNQDSRYQKGDSPTHGPALDGVEIGANQGHQTESQAGEDSLLGEEINRPTPEP
jgi:hypothetical protein